LARSRKTFFGLIRNCSKRALDEPAGVRRKIVGR
jgi:hypothetical protein